MEFNITDQMFKMDVSIERKGIIPIYIRITYLENKTAEMLIYVQITNIQCKV